MKAMLIMDMPSSCASCDLADNYDTQGCYCVPQDQYFDGEDSAESRASFCPLKSIDEILGGNENG